MTSNESIPDEDAFIDSLNAYHDALCDGLHEDQLLPDPELDQRLKNAQKCLRLLHEFWPRINDASINSPSTSEGGGTGSPDGDPEIEDSLPPDPRKTRLGRFEVERQLGQGAHGIVFLARDVTLGRKVALKIPRPETLIDSQLRSRFLREAQAASSLNHPNLVSVHEAGEFGPICYIAQEYCPGESLAGWLAEKVEPVEPRSAASFIATLADAIGHAHRQGVLHRDLKPENVILEPTLDEPSRQPTASDLLLFKPKITDFGLAKLIEGDGGETRSGMLLGTPLYMAPEQVNGQVHSIGPSTDVYALGVMLYELLTRRLPFHGTTPIETLRRIVSDDVVPPTRFSRAIPADLEAICLKCLEKDPAQRYETTDLLAQDLRRYLTGRPTLARPIHLAKRLYKFARRRPALAGLISLSLIATIALATGGWLHAARMQVVLDQVVQQREVAVQQEELARNRELRVRQYLYASDMNRAWASWKNGHIAETENLLQQYRPHVDEPDLRSFTWHYLWRLTHGDLMTLQGHRSDVHSLAYFPDGKRIVTVGHDGTAGIWDLRTGMRISTLMEGHAGELNAVAVSPDGTIIATGSDDSIIRLFEASTGTQIDFLQGHSESIYAVSFSPDGKQLASGGPDRIVKLWDVETRKSAASLSGHDGAIESLAFSPEGDRLASASGDGTAILWDLASGSPQFQLTGHENVVRSVTCSPDGRFLATGSDDRTVLLWSTETGKVEAKFQGHDEVVQCVRFSPDGGTLAAAVKDGTVQLWNVESGEPVRKIRGHTGRIWSVDYSPDGTQLATASGDATVRIWKAGNGTSPERRLAVPGNILSFSIRKSNNDFSILELIGGDSGTRIGLQKIDESSLDQSPDVIPFCRETSRSGAFCVDGKRVAIAVTDPGSRPESSLSVYLQPVASSDRRQVLSDSQVGTGKAYSSSCTRFSSDGTRLAVGRDDGVIDLWQLSLQQALHKLHGHADAVNALAFSPDGTWLASASEDQTIRFWNLDNPGDGSDRRGHRSGVTAIAFAPNGELLASGGRDQTILLWNPVTQTVIATLPSHGAALKSLAFSPDSRTLASGDALGTVKLWDVPTHQELVSWQAHEKSVITLAFSSDGKVFASGGKREEGGCEIVTWNADQTLMQH